MTEDENIIKEQVYNATNTGAAFHADNSFVRLAFGPVGSGKSVLGCIEIFRRAAEQEPGEDGIRRSRWAVVRNTYPELKSTTIKTWLSWFPEEHFGKIKWDSPITHHIKVGDIDLEVLFLALDSESDIKKLRSLELTGAYVNELQYIHAEVFKTCTERVNRFPSKKDGAKITWTGVIADTNPPDSDHWIYELFEEVRPENYKIFKYAPALIKVDDKPTNGEPYAVSKNGTVYVNNYEADYRVVQNDPNYWLNLVWGRDDEEIKVICLGEYGYVQDGRPVHPEYNDNAHYVNRELKYNPLVELGLGWDFGLSPACAIVQLQPNGQFQVLDELFNDYSGLRQFAEDEVIPYLDRNYPGWRDNYESRHDPAGSQGAQTDGKTCEDILRELGIKSYPAADSNSPTARRDALKYFLGKMVDGQPGFIVSNKCKRIRKALAGKFQYSRIKNKDGMYHDKPLKNKYSHIAEGLEYIAMNYCREVKRPPPKPATNRISKGGFFTL
jgi:hypothetical protein